MEFTLGTIIIAKVVAAKCHYLLYTVTFLLLLFFFYGKISIKLHYTYYTVRYHSNCYFEHKIYT